MPNNTPKGWPYPIGTDRVADGDDAMRAIAEKADAVVPMAQAAGFVAVNVAASVQGTAAVTFPVGRFTQSPIVVVSCSSHSTYLAAGTSAAVGGFTAAVRQVDATAATVTVTVMWHAVQMLVGSGSG